MSARVNYCFTINNYSDDTVELLSNLNQSGKVNYLVMGFEIGEEGTPHIQGYLQLPKKKRFSQVKELIGGTGHITEEYLNSSAAACIQYCKKDGDFLEFGHATHKQGMSKNYIKSMEPNWYREWILMHYRIPI